VSKRILVVEDQPDNRQIIFSVQDYRRGCWRFVTLRLAFL